MIFAKLENEKPIFCPNNGYRGNVAISNLPKYYEAHLEEAKADGWKRFIPFEGEYEGELETMETTEYIIERVKLSD